MCKTKMAVDASDPNSVRTRRTRATQSPRTPSGHRLSTSATTASSNSARTRPSQSPRTASGYRLPTGVSSSSSTSDPQTSTSTSSANYTTTSSSILSSRTSLSSLRESLSQNPHIYDFSEIRTATNNFLAKRHSSSSSSTPCWRCNLRGTDTIVFQRKFRRKIEMLQLKQLLAVICRSNHGSVIKLLGASISGDHIYLVYEFIKGSNLADCLRNSRNPHYTVLSTWLSRMQIAYDLAAALDYIHNKTGLNLNLVHSHIKSSSIIVTEPNFNGRICHFGAAQLCGELTEEDNGDKKKRPISIGEIREANEEDEDASPLSPERSKKLTRSDSRAMQFEGVRGYMSPEFRSTGAATQKSDVYAFGVVILELLSGEEPLKYKYDKSSGDFVRTSVIDTANAAIHGGDNAVDGEREGSLRRWIDRKLKDSFPVDVAEKLTRLALECVHVDPDKRPDMGRVGAKMSRMYLKSKKWSDDVKMPTDQISVSLAPR